MGNFLKMKKKKPQEPFDYPKDTIDADTAVFTDCSMSGARRDSFILDQRLVVMGSGGVGKSAMLIRFVSGQFVTEYDPTIEDAYRKTIIVDGETVLLDILDTAGQEEFSALQDQWMRDGRGFICVFSITDRQSFSSISQLYDKLLMIQDLDHVPCILVGNKTDLEDSRVVSKQEGKDLAEKLQMYTYIETSCKINKNVTEAFYHMVRAVRRTEPPPDNATKKKKK